MTLAIIIAIASIIVLGLLLNINKLIRLRHEVDNQLSQIQIQLQRRHDLIPNLVATIRGIANFEATTLENVSRARSEALAKGRILPESFAAENRLTRALTEVYNLAENYPELKAHGAFTVLLEELRHTENLIAQSRQQFNDSRMLFEHHARQLLGRALRGLFESRPLPPYFEADEAARSAPAVSFL